MRNWSDLEIKFQIKKTFEALPLKTKCIIHDVNMKIVQHCVQYWYIKGVICHCGVTGVLVEPDNEWTSLRVREGQSIITHCKHFIITI